MTGMEESKSDRPAMNNRIIEEMKAERGNSEDMDDGMPMRQTDEIPTEEPVEEEMPMEEPKGLMARRG